MKIPDSAKHLCHILLTHADNCDLWYVKEDRYSWIEAKWDDSYKMMAYTMTLLQMCAGTVAHHLSGP